MTASWSPIGARAPATQHGSPPSALAGSDAPAQFAALVAGARAPAVAAASGQTATAAKPSADDVDPAFAELEANIAALAASAQAAFMAAGTPQNQATVLEGFVEALGQLLSEFGAEAAEGVQEFPGGTLAGLTSLAQDALSPGAGPLALAQAVLVRLGLDAETAARASGAGGILAVAGPAVSPAAGTAKKAPDPGLATGTSAPAQRGPAAETRGWQPAGAGLNQAGTGDGQGAADGAKAATGSGSHDTAGAPPSVRVTEAEFDTALRSVAGAGEIHAGSRGASEARAPMLSDPSLAPQAAAAGQAGPAFSRHLGAQVRAAQITEGATRIELTPRGLGDIEIDMRHDEAGKLRIVLKAENPAVLTAFRNDRDMLIGVLRDGGVAVEEAELSFESFGGHQSRQQPDRDGWRPAILEDTALPAELGIPPSGTSSGRHSTSRRAGLDIIT